MIKINYNGNMFAYLTKRSSWVDENNAIVNDLDLKEALFRQAKEAGYSEENFAMPITEAAQYLNAAKPEIVQPTQTKKEPIKLDVVAAVPKKRGRPPKAKTDLIVYLDI